jgi:isochorismate synthase
MIPYTNYGLIRLPYVDEVYLIAQTTGSVQKFLRYDELEKYHGFVLIPFETTMEHPVLMIRPDVCLNLTVDHLKNEVKPFRAEVYDGDKTEYTEVFSKFHDAVNSDFSKLVLSRKIEGTYEGDELSVFIKACEKYPRAMVYLCHTQEEGTWIGSTPEILLSGSHSHYRTVALAGTMPFAEYLEWSDKNKEEQAIVARYIRNTLAPYLSVLEEEGPYTSRAGHLAHLKTEFHFSPLSSVSPTKFIELLHPTPAVCGMPKDEAKKFILNTEPYDRCYYSGVVGVLDTKGETNLYVNIRCAHFKKGKVTLYAGGGILPDSNVDSEWNETESKLQTICSVLK